MSTRSSMLLAVLMLSALGCGPGDPCSKTSPCPGDTPASQVQKDQCKAVVQAYQSAACYGDGVSLTNCQADNIVCGGNGKTDSALSAVKATNNCTNQRANFLSCCTKNSSSTVCH